MSAFQNKADVQEKEVKKFDGTGYDKDLVEALERDIISQNPNVKWYVFITNENSIMNFGVVLFNVIVCCLCSSLLLPVFVVSVAKYVPEVPLNWTLHIEIKHFLLEFRICHNMKLPYTSAITRRINMQYYAHMSLHDLYTNQPQH